MANILKMSYQGVLKHIAYDNDTPYEELVKSAMELYHIPKDYQPGLQLVNDKGEVFERDIFEYFLILFPNPKIVFEIRLDYSKIRRTVTISKLLEGDSSKMAFGYSKLNNKRPRSDDEVYEAAPVRRQNCFVGMFPTTTSTMTMEINVIRSCSKRIRLDTKAAAKKITTTKTRRIRL